MVFKGTLNLLFSNGRLFVMSKFYTFSVLNECGP